MPAKKDNNFYSTFVLPNRPTMSFTQPNPLLLNHLKKYFGFDHFKDQQEAIITAVLEKQDCLVIMPTGGGKSMCFQLPSLLFPGITLVISPLIALMKDQVDGLRSEENTSELPSREQLVCRL